LLDNTLDVFDSFVNVGRSYSDVAGETIVNDAIMMPIGFFIVFIYVVVMLGKFTCTEQRALLALGGLTCIGLTIGVMYGLCSAMGLFYGPMHNVIPFLLLGIGIDDMFVIMQCYDNLALNGERSGDVVHDIGLTMRHAGVAITVTSFTDFIVFALGATTVLPALRSFCLWCSIGIVAVYLFQATLFAAFLALDCRRLKGNRNGLCPCYRHAEKPSSSSSSSSNSSNSSNTRSSKDFSFSQKIFDYLGRVILSWPGMIVVLAAAAGLTAGGVYGLTQLQQKFDPVWFLPPSSYIAEWFTANAAYFPTEGESVTVYFTGIDWPSESAKIGLLEEELRKEISLVSKVDSWYDKFTLFVKEQTMYNETDFDNLLTYYMFTPPAGFPDQAKFRFEDDRQLECGEPAPPILLSTIGFTHTRLDDRDAQIAALNRIKDMIDAAGFSGNAFPMAREYSTWETNEVITTELFRNLGLALACVFVTTLVLLADLLGSVYVLVCVLLSLLDLCGYMHFWGLTVDVVSSVNIIIAIGKV
jgi:predicted RND superfamily exporter protein